MAETITCDSCRQECCDRRDDKMLRYKVQELSPRFWESLPTWHWKRIDLCQTCFYGLKRIAENARKQAGGVEP